MGVAFLFDCDGVLVDSAEIHWRAWQKVMAEDPTLSFSREAFVETLGKRNDLILKEVAPKTSMEKRKALAEKKERLTRKLAASHLSLLPGMEKFLMQVKERKIPRIIASSAPIENLEFFLKVTPLARYFDQFVSADEVKEGKPAPDIFIEAARRLGFLPKDSIVFEDAPAGIMAGKKAGSFVVGLATTHPASSLTKSDWVVKNATQLNLEEILSLFEKWQKS